MVKKWSYFWHFSFALRFLAPPMQYTFTSSIFFIRYRYSYISCPSLFLCFAFYFHCVCSHTEHFPSERVKERASEREREGGRGKKRKRHTHTHIVIQPKTTFPFAAMLLNAKLYLWKLRIFKIKDPKTVHTHTKFNVESRATAKNAIWKMRKDYADLFSLVSKLNQHTEK